MPKITPQLNELFWSKVDVRAPRKCWPWRAGCDDYGYGSFKLGGKTERAPRVAFLLRNGRLPRFACHTCDNPKCCNPGHIFDGTQADNLFDMHEKGRRKYTIVGEKHPRSVLNGVKVRRMRQEYESSGISLRALAHKYKCGYSTAERVIRRKSWKHIK